MNSLRERVKALREAKGMTQRRLAELAKVTPATISRLESGKIADLKSSALIGIADALGISLDYLVGRARELTPADVINYDPIIQAIVHAYLNLGPEGKKNLSEFMIYLEFKSKDKLIGKDSAQDRMMSKPDLIIELGHTDEKRKPEADDE